VPFASQPRAEPVTRRDKRRLVVAGALLIALFIAAGVWAAVRPGAYGSSRAGCVTVTLPGTMGGGLLHQCGSGAVAMCKRAFAGTDKISQLTRPQCRLAGLSPAPGAGRPAASP
jgi:hypothetical protein